MVVGELFPGKWIGAVGRPRCSVTLFEDVVHDLLTRAAQVHYLRDSAVNQIIVMDHGKIAARGRYARKPAPLMQFFSSWSRFLEHPQGADPNPLHMQHAERERTSSRSLNRRTRGFDFQTNIATTTRCWNALDSLVVHCVGQGKTRM